MSDVDLFGDPVRTPADLCRHPRPLLARCAANNGVGYFCDGCGRWVTAAVTTHRGTWLPAAHPVLADVTRVELPTRAAA